MLTADVEKVTEDLKALYDEGYRSVAIVLANSYLWPEHEQQVAEIARKLKFPNVSVSSELQAKVNFVSRGQSTSADAYLTPVVRRYLASFAKGFKDSLAGCQVAFMQSDGALAEMNSFTGLRAILSGPAGGVVGFAKTSYDALEGSPVVGFDMGGTVSASSLGHTCLTSSPPMCRVSAASTSTSLRPRRPA